jgi:hypothetical protein
VSSFCVLAGGRDASAFFSYKISPLRASITMTAAARVFGAIFETDPGGGATGSAFRTSEMPSGISIGRTGLNCCFDFGLAATQVSASTIVQK